MAKARLKIPRPDLRVEHTDSVELWTPNMFGGKTAPARLLDPCSRLKNMIDWQENTQRTNPQLSERAKG